MSLFPEGGKKKNSIFGKIPDNCKAAPKEGESLSPSSQPGLTGTQKFQSGALRERN